MVPTLDHRGVYNGVFRNLKGASISSSPLPFPSPFSSPPLVSLPFPYPSLPPFPVPLPSFPSPPPFPPLKSRTR